MIKVYKSECNDYDEIRIINLETGEFTFYHVDNFFKCPFGIPYNTTVFKMGYPSVKECLKTLKDRNFLGHEVNYKEQKESERIGYIKLGAERIKRAGRVNANDFEDICNKLADYGMGFCDAQNCITETYIHSIQL